MIHPQFSEAASHISAAGICDALVELVNIASPTGHEAGVAGYLLDRMQKAGLDAEFQFVDSGRPNAVGQIALAAGLMAGARPVLAETYPAKPVKIIVSTSPGGITDIAARILGAHITDRSGQPVVSDTRAGASGNIAMDAGARAAPDGYTLGLASTGNITINPLLFAHLPFDP